MLKWPKRLVRFIEKLKEKIRGLEKENQQLKQRIKDLEKKLAYYENSNTPPSARKFPKKKKK